MNNKAASKVLMDNVIYIILLLIFVTIIFLVINQQRNGAKVWEDYYAKETSKLINSAQEGDEITLDIHQATIIAQKNELPSFSKTFTFDNANNELCVSLSLGKKTCYSYFNNVKVDREIKLGVPNNIMILKISKKQNESPLPNEQDTS